MRVVSAFLRGWAAYVRYGNSVRPFDKISTFAVARLALFKSKGHNSDLPGNGRWWRIRLKPQHNEAEGTHACAL